MIRRNRLLAQPAALLALFFGLTGFSATFAQDKNHKDPVASGSPVLWQKPDDIASRDLFLGPGGPAMQPDLSNVYFVSEETGGYSVKFKVKDGAGHKWVAKMGNEARPETAAVRLLSAVGYVTEINYLAPCVHIKGAPKPRKEVQRCEGDGFADVRFEARPDGVERLDTWSWDKNPFAGTREFQGLLVLMALLNNWDLKDSNTKVLLVKDENGNNELHYIISDLGATFGKTGGPISHSRNEPEKYARTKFIEGVEHGRVRFAFRGKFSGRLDNITVAQAKWIGRLLAQLSDQQLDDVFRAANFTPEEALMLKATVESRVSELVSLPG